MTQIQSVSSNFTALSSGVNLGPIFPQSPSESELIDLLQLDAEYWLTKDSELRMIFWQIEKYLRNYRPKASPLDNYSSESMCLFSLLVAESIKTDGIIE